MRRCPPSSPTHPFPSGCSQSISPKNQLTIPGSLQRQKHHYPHSRPDLVPPVPVRCPRVNMYDMMAHGGCPGFPRLPPSSVYTVTGTSTMRPLDLVCIPQSHNDPLRVWVQFPSRRSTSNAMVDGDSSVTMNLCTSPIEIKPPSRQEKNLLPGSPREISANRTR